MPNVTLNVSDALLAEIQVEAQKEGVTPPNWARSVIRDTILERRVAAERTTRETQRQQAVQQFASTELAKETAAMTALENSLKATL